MGELAEGHGADTAVLGFSTNDPSGTTQYFPLYASTYRGLPAATFSVFLSDDGAEMWVRSTWKGNETLAHHRFGSGRCLTGYGETSPIAVPIPSHLSGGPLPFPPLPPGAKPVATFGSP